MGFQQKCVVLLRFTILTNVRLYAIYSSQPLRPTRLARQVRSATVRRTQLTVQPMHLCLGVFRSREYPLEFRQTSRKERYRGKSRSCTPRHHRSTECRSSWVSLCRRHSSSSLYRQSGFTDVARSTSRLVHQLPHVADRDISSSFCVARPLEEEHLDGKR